jgi:hypothetical protein
LEGNSNKLPKMIFKSQSRTRDHSDGDENNFVDLEKFKLTVRFSQNLIVFN